MCCMTSTLTGVFLFRCYQLRHGHNRGSHQAADERVHGVVPRAAPQDRARQPPDAQLGDLETPRRGVEDAH